MVIVTAGVLCGRSLGRRIDVKIMDILVFQVHMPSSPEEAGVSGVGRQNLSEIRTDPRSPRNSGAALANRTFRNDGDVLFYTHLVAFSHPCWLSTWNEILLRN